MRVSKILCATLLCSMVGTAFGVPTPEDRKQLCEQNPDKFVWVEKTQTCIPQNPCLSENKQFFDSYCMQAPTLDTMVLERFIQNTRGVNVTSYKKIAEYEREGARFVAYKLSDGDYVVFDKRHFPDDIVTGSIPHLVILDACWAFGKKTTTHLEEWFEYDINTAYCIDVLDYDLCQDIADFASLLNKQVCTGSVEFAPKVCKITCG